MARKRQPLTLADLPPHWRRQAIEQLGLKPVKQLPDVIRTEAKIVDGTVIVTLPHPRGTSPNDRLHHHAKARAVKSLRSSVADACVMAGADMGWTEATAQATVYYRHRRKADRDNWNARLKAAFDGLQDAGVIVDDNGLHVAEPVILVDPERPRVEIRVDRSSTTTQLISR